MNINKQLIYQKTFDLIQNDTQEIKTKKILAITSLITFLCLILGTVLLIFLIMDTTNIALIASGICLIIIGILIGLFVSYYVN